MRKLSDTDLDMILRDHASMLFNWDNRDDISVGHTDEMPGGKCADLAHVDLSGKDLSGVDLRNSNLSGADLSDADLSGARLGASNMAGVDLSGANLSGAHLPNVDLRNAILTGADLSGADLTGADLADADLSGANLTGADFSCTNLRGAIGVVFTYTCMWVFMGLNFGWPDPEIHSNCFTDKAKAMDAWAKYKAECTARGVTPEYIAIRNGLTKTMDDKTIVADDWEDMRL